MLNHRRQPSKEVKVQEIKAMILDRAAKKMWYVRYTVFFDNGNRSTAEESTKVPKREKSLTWMQTKYLPVWIARKKEKLKIQEKANHQFAYFADIFLAARENFHDYQNTQYRTSRVLEDFGKKSITSITKLEIKLWLQALKHKATGIPLSKNSKLKYLGIFRGIFELAIDAQLISHNLCDEIRIQQERRNLNKIEPFSVEETCLLIQRSQCREKYGQLLHEYLGIAFNMGMSPAEILGLQLSDIDLKNRILRIQRNITKGKIKETKTTYRDRILPILDGALPYIETLDFQAKKKRSIWLFSGDDGNYLPDIEIIRGEKEIIKENLRIKKTTKWYRLLLDCGIPYRDLKNTRHTFAVRALETKSLTFQELANFLGHGSLQMILNHYAKWIGGKAMSANKNIRLFGDHLGDPNQKKKGG